MMERLTKAVSAPSTHVDTALRDILEASGRPGWTLGSFSTRNKWSAPDLLLATSLLLIDRGIILPGSRLATGTFFNVLNKLVSDGWVEKLDEDFTVVYTLGEDGDEAVEPKRQSVPVERQLPSLVDIFLPGARPT